MSNVRADVRWAIINWLDPNRNLEETVAEVEKVLERAIDERVAAAVGFQERLREKKIERALAEQREAISAVIEQKRQGMEYAIGTGHHERRYALALAANIARNFGKEKS